MKKILLPFCVLALSAGTAVMGQSVVSTTQKDALFQSGKEMFESRNWEGAIDQLSRYKAAGATADLQDADYMIAASAFEKNKPDALELLTAFRQQYPTSAYAEEVCFMIATIYFDRGEYADALSWFGEVSMDRLPLNLQPAYFQRMGVSYLKLGNTAQAYPLFETLASTDNEYTNSARYYLAYIDYADGRYAKALERFEALPQTGEYASTVPYYITQILFIQGKYDQALSHAQQLVGSTDDAAQTAELNRIIAECYFKQGNNAKALPYFKQYFATPSVKLRSSALNGGIAAYDQGQPQTAVTMLSKAASGDDRTAQQAYLLLGHAYVESGDLRNAGLSFERASKMTADAALQEEAWYNYGLTVHQSSYSPFNESVVVFESFLNQYPDSKYADKVNDCLVEVYMTTRNYEAALASIDKITRPGQKILTAKQRILFQLGTQQVANGDLASAESYFTKAINLGNLNKEVRAQAFFWRGECEYRDGQYTQADNDFRQFVALTDGNDADTYALARYNLGYTAFKQQKFPTAVEWFEKYINIPSEYGKNTYADALNRLGDVSFYQRQFAKAEDYYTRAANTSGGTGDYAMFQKGFMAGLQKNYSGKISAMQQLRKTWPQSDYVDDALFEEGKTYVTLNQTDNAVSSFRQVIAQFPNSSLARQAGLQLGMLYFNAGQNDNAIAAYKQVIDTYPGSDEARTAAEDLKTIYVEINDIPAYAAYINTLKGKVQFAAGEQDSLTYLAAERVLARGNAAQSKQALVNYLQSYPEGAFRLPAYTELGRLYFAEKDYTKALEAYGNVLQQHDNRYTEEALARTAEIEFLNGDTREALNTFRNLAERAESKENKEAARVGILRTTSTLGLDEEAVVAANDLLAIESLSPELRNEALYTRAKALLAQGQTAYAKKDLQELATDMRNVYGAEAAYRLGQLYYDAKDYGAAEKTAFALIDSATPHHYWLARGFILLSDVYIAQGDTFQAKQYLQSLESNYSGNDDIATLIKQRYQKIGD